MTPKKQPVRTPDPQADEAPDLEAEIAQPAPAIEDLVAQGEPELEADLKQGQPEPEPEPQTAPVEIPLEALAEIVFIDSTGARFRMEPWSPRGHYILRPAY